MAEQTVVGMMEVLTAALEHMYRTLDRPVPDDETLVNEAIHVIMGLYGAGWYLHPFADIADGMKLNPAHRSE